MRFIINVLKLVYDNWSAVIICTGLIIAVCQKVKKWMLLSKQDKIIVAKNKLKETILKYISDAEFEYIEISQSGSLKRSKVISQIYEDYPILSKISDQSDVIKWIDELIDSALPTLREVIKRSEK